VSCSGSAGTCILDGNTEKRIFAFYDVEKDGELLIENLIWRNGRIDKGGCLFVEGGRVVIQHSTFTNCEATHHSIGGGGIFVWGSIDYVRLHSVRFLANKSPVYGSDLYAYQGSINFYGCEFRQPETAGSSNVHNKGASMSFASNCPKGRHGVLSEEYNPPPASFLSGVGVTGELVSFSTEGIFCSLCQPGTFGAEEYALSCSPCGQGMYSETMGATSNSSCLMCQRGTYQENEIATDINGCMSCSEGKFSQVSAAKSRFQCQNCEPGTYSSSAGATSCFTCEQGKYSFEMASICTDCPAGRASSDERSNSCTACAPGKYTSTPGELTCANCALGTYAKSDASVTCAACPGGKSGNADRQSCDLCPSGKYSHPASDSCTDCDLAGGWVSLAGVAFCEYCGPGFFANGITYQCQQCEINTYSVGGTNACTLCPSGTDSLGAVSCSPCPPGTIPVGSICQRCLKGKHAEFGATICLSCSLPGEYSDAEGSADCKTAPAGHKPNTDRTDIVKCSPGTFSVGGSDTCTQCGEGETSTEGAAGCSTCATCAVGRFKLADCSPSSGTHCADCAAGQASMGGEVTACTECSGPGQYADENLSSVCKTAPAGHKPRADRTGLEVCPKSTFSIGGTDTCTDCSHGGHSTPGSSACERCSTGMYYDEDTNVCELCPKDTFTMSGATDVSGCALCEDGGHSQPGSGYCEKCSTGNYYDEVMTTCILCPKNTFSPSGATDISGCFPCEDSGHSQPGSEYCEKCSTGKYYNETENICQDCPKNSASISGAADISGCGDCNVAIGEYAAPGSGYCSSCSSGKYYNEPQNDCIACPSGKFTATGAIGLWQCAICQVGFYR